MKKGLLIIGLIVTVGCSNSENRLDISKQDNSTNQFKSAQQTATDINMDKNTNTDIEANADIEGDTGIGANTDIKANTEIETNTDIESNTDIEANADTKTDVDINDTNSSNNNINIDEIESISNLFFFKNEVSVLEYHAKILFDDKVENVVKLNINELTHLKHGRLYELKLEPIEGVPEERLNLGYCYVQKDKIYKIDATKENLNQLETSQQVPEGSVIVCQDQEMKDALGQEETGWHHYIEVSGDQRAYHSYNNQVSTGYYESFTWEKHKGLINYSSGYGAGRDSMDIDRK